MIRRTGAPTSCVPSIFCILIHSAATRFETCRATQRTLLLRCCAGGELSAFTPQSTPPIAPCSPSTYVVRGFGPKPPRIHTGKTPLCTRDEQGAIAAERVDPPSAPNTGAINEAKSTRPTATERRRAMALSIESPPKLSSTAANPDDRLLTNNVRPWEPPIVTVEYHVTYAAIPCSLALFRCRCGASTVEYDLKRKTPDHWVAVDGGSYLCPHCATAPRQGSAQSGSQPAR
jgi:hypothetical protein